MRLLLRAGLREMARHPAQLALALAGIALGVAVGVAVDLANESARRAFRLSTEATSGRATHVIAAGSAGLDERLLVRLRTEAGVRAAAPVVEGVLTLPGRPGRVLRLLGVDPFSEAPFRPFTAASAGPAEPLERFLLEPGAVLLARATADELGLEVDARFPVGAGPRRAELQLVGRLDPEDDLARAALASIVVADIATAQETLGRAGRLDRIELVLPEGAAGDRIAARIHALLPPDARLEPVGTRTAALESLTRAFRFNLQALALLALLCGAFLIFNTTTFAVVRRRALYGRLRAAGAGERELLFAVLGEAAVVGAVGAAIGVGLGVLLGRGLVALVLATVSDLYFTLTVRELALPPATLAAGSALGVGASVAAALLPALEATRSPLRAALAVSALESRAAGLARRGALWGSGVVALGALLVALPTRSLPAAFAGFLFLVVGAAMFVPLLLGGSARLLARAPGLVVRQTARGVERALARTAPAVAALAVAVAVSLSVAITIASFRTAVVDWLNATLVGDLYLSAPSGPGSPAAAFPEELALALRGAPRRRAGPPAPRRRSAARRRRAGADSPRRRHSIPTPSTASSSAPGSARRRAPRWPPEPRRSSRSRSPSGAVSVSATRFASRPRAETSCCRSPASTSTTARSAARSSSPIRSSCAGFRAPPSPPSRSGSRPTAISPLSRAPPSGRPRRSPSRRVRIAT